MIIETKDKSITEIDMPKKKKIITISDHPLSPSGVGTQTKYFIEAMLASGEYTIYSLAGPIKHEDYKVKTVGEYGTDWIIHPVDGYGTQDLIRTLIHNEKPDALWFMTDPRFYGWLWEIEDEIRDKVPMVYYHVWDNFPLPMFNKPFYDSNDSIVTISKVTDEIIKEVSPDVHRVYHPHGVDSDVFKPLPEIDKDNFRDVIFKEKPERRDSFFIMWNNRNARRKQSGTLIFWFKEFLEKIGDNSKATLFMHTDVFDEHGQDLEEIIKVLGLTNGEVIFSTQKLSTIDLSGLYNVADVTVNIADAEGFGLATLESLSCGTPIIVNKTGGLKEQVTDGETEFGVGIEPCAKAIIGSQNIPYIYEDRVNKEMFLDALEKIYSMSKEDREELGKKGSEHVEKNYSFKKYQTKWVEIMNEIIERNGSWGTRKNYNHWTFEELV